MKILFYLNIWICCSQIGLRQNLIKDGSFEKWNIEKPEFVHILAFTPGFHKTNIKLNPNKIDKPDFIGRFHINCLEGISYVDLANLICGSESVALEF